MGTEFQDRFPSPSSNQIATSDSLFMEFPEKSQRIHLEQLYVGPL